MVWVVVCPHEYATVREIGSAGGGGGITTRSPPPLSYIVGSYKSKIRKTTGGDLHKSIDAPWLFMMGCVGQCVEITVPLY